MVFSKYQFFFVLSSIIIVLPPPQNRLFNYWLKITVIFLWISIIYRITWLIEQFCSCVFQRFYSRISTNRIQYTYSLIGIKLLYHQHFHHHGYYRNFYHCNQVLLHYHECHHVWYFSTIKPSSRFLPSVSITSSFKSYKFFESD